MREKTTEFDLMLGRMSNALMSAVFDVQDEGLAPSSSEAVQCAMRVQRACEALCVVAKVFRDDSPEGSYRERLTLFIEMLDRDARTTVKIAELWAPL